MPEAPEEQFKEVTNQLLRGETEIGEEIKDIAEKDPRIYFAAERTLLAWIRTGLALMGFGFAIARFGQTLREFEGQHGATTGSPGGVFTGVSLTVIGVISILLGGLGYIRNVQRLRKGTWIPGRISLPVVTLATLLVLLGVVMIIKLKQIP